MELKRMYLYHVRISYLSTLMNEVHYPGLVIAENADDAKLKFRKALSFSSDDYICSEVRIVRVNNEVFLLEN